MTLRSWKFDPTAVARFPVGVGIDTVGGQVDRYCCSPLTGEVRVTKDMIDTAAEASPTEPPIELLEVRVLRVQPGDVIVIRLARRVHSDARENIRKLVEEQFPGHRCLVLQDGAELTITRPK